MITLGMTHDFEPVDGEPGVLIGSARIGGLDLHVFAVEVEVNAEDLQAATGDPLRRLERLDALATPEAPYETTEIPGYEGQWVIWAEPFCT